MRELSKEEIELINKMAQSYWKENNRTHIDNEEEWNLTRGLVKKLTIPNVSNCDSDTKDLIEHTKRVLDLIKSKSGMAVKVLSNRVNNKLEQLN